MDFNSARSSRCRGGGDWTRHVVVWTLVCSGGSGSTL